MGPDGSDSAEARARATMKRIAVRAHQSNLARASELQDAVSAALEGRLDEAQRLGAQRVAHQLYGSAGTFGYPRASELGRELEQFFEAETDQPGTLLLAVDWLNALQRELASGPPLQGEPTSETESPAS
ncbi:MAG: Hpt domain-containing protein [Propionibacteriaceae bacterium]|nr:Hpt domain-containing protein [Propionibacteriaceae bacterium]